VGTRRLSVDKALLQRGLCDTVEHAQELIQSGVVLVNGSIALTSNRQVASHDELLVKHVDQFVSRGGLKLEAALTSFGVEVADKRVLDAGASTGGFTDCVLQRGAREVVAIDVGKAQLHERIASDSRVVVIDSFNVRRLIDHDLPSEFDRNFDLVVADLSFISLRSVAQSLSAKLDPAGDLIVLVKPQFEATKREVDKGQGVIADQGIRDRVLSEVGAAMHELGLIEQGRTESPIRGAEGNIEYLVWYRFEACA
jgi:23S rRNA (cytidine1920-2'-O)/16S rRNA (cytidine1409-2'-O)-methyltransferase